MAKRTPNSKQALDLTIPSNATVSNTLLIRELNTRMEQIGSLISTLTGVGDRTPVIKNHVDLSGKRITNAQDAQADSDYITRREAKKNAGYATAGVHKLGNVEIENLTVTGTFRGSRTRTRPGGQPSGGGSTPVSGISLVEDDLTPTGAETGTSWTLSSTPTGDTLGFLNGLKLRQVGSSPGSMEYTRSGTSVTTGRSLIAGERLEFEYGTGGSGLTEDDLTPTAAETGTSWTTSASPTAGSQLVFLNGAKLKKVSSGPSASEYTQSGTTLTTGHSLIAGERLETTYA